MIESHDLDQSFTAAFDDGDVYELQQLLATARAEGTTDELAAELADVAAMVDVVHVQLSTARVVARRARSRRIVAKRAVQVAAVAGLALMSTSAAAAAGILPAGMRPFDRPASSAAGHLAVLDPPPTRVIDDAGSAPPTAVVAEPVATVESTAPTMTAGDHDADPRWLCGRWSDSSSAGVELDATARTALITLAVRAGVAPEQLCAPYVSSGPATAPDVATSSPPATAPLTPDAGSPAPVAPLADAPADDAAAGSAAGPTPTPTATPSPTPPPTANAEQPPAGEPGHESSGDAASAGGTPDDSADAHAGGSANAHGGNANANGGNADPGADAPANSGNANPNANGANANGGNANANANGANANGGNPNANGANANANGASTDAGDANGSSNGTGAAHGHALDHGTG